jgi:oleandomycin transport system permease protein
MNAVRTARHSATLAGRTLLKIRHSPDSVFDVLLMPVVFVLMFVFLFGNSVSGDWRDYLQLVVPGIAVQALMFASMGTALGLHSDVHTGVFDRFRSLPIARSAPLIGHLLGDLVKYVLCIVVVFGFATLLGFRVHGDPLDVLAAFALLLAFAFSVAWIAALVGLTVSSPQGIQAVSFVVVLPLTFGSNIFVPAENLPTWLQGWVRINPVSQLADATRGLLLDVPVGNAVRNGLLCVAALLVVFVPLAIRAYRRNP